MAVNSFGYSFMYCSSASVYKKYSMSLRYKSFSQPKNFTHICKILFHSRRRIFSVHF